MNVSSLTGAEPFTTKDGSTIRELHHTERQSLAEATLTAGQATERHYHARTEEIYLVVDGAGELEVNGELRRVAAGDAALIPPGAPHRIRSTTASLRFLCCCAPPYSHDDTFVG